MVRTDEAFDMAFGRLANDRAAMSANVEKRVYLSVIVTYDDDRIFADIVQEVVTRIWYLAGVTGEQPAAPPDVFHLSTVEQLLVIKRPRQPVTGLARGNPFFESRNFIST
jgi:hypothetical protein